MRLAASSRSDLSSALAGFTLSADFAGCATVPPRKVNSYHRAEMPAAPTASNRPSANSSLPLVKRSRFMDSSFLSDLVILGARLETACNLRPASKCAGYSGAKPAFAGYVELSSVTGERLRSLWPATTVARQIPQIGFPDRFLGVVLWCLCCPQSVPQKVRDVSGRRV